MPVERNPRRRKAGIVKGERRCVKPGPMDSDGPITLAAAICFLAAGQHSKDHSHQQQMAAVFFNDCQTDFNGVKIDKAVEAFVLDIIKNAGKTAKK